MLSLRRALGAALTPAARRMTGVDPNLLTLVSFAAGLGAGLAFALAGRGAGYYAAAGVLIVVSGSADALDGMVARIHGRVSVAGDFLDHTGDRVVEIAILAGIAASPGASTTFGLAVVILTLLSSYVGTQIEATFRHRAYSGLGKAEQFIGLIVFAGVLAVAPSLSVSAGGVRLSAANLLFVLLGLGTLAALVHRVRLAMSLAAGASARGADQPGPSHPRVPPR